MRNLITVLVFMIPFTGAQSQDCFWAKSGNGTSQDESKAITTDSQGNVYATGKFESSSITFGTITLNASSGTNFFIVKYDPSGNVLWAKTANGIAEGYGITTDSSGNVIVSGYYDGISTTFSGVTLTNAGNGDAFLLKYNAAGSLLWARSIGAASGAEYGYAVATDLAGAVYITGRFNSSSLTIGSTPFTNQGLSGPDLFIAKYDSLGNLLWADATGGSFEDIANGIACDTLGHVYLTGNYSSPSMLFGSYTLTSPGTGQNNLFITKYDSAGVIIWANAVEGYPWGDVFGYDIQTHGNSIYVQGEFHGDSLTFGDDTITNVSAGSSDVFTAKFDSNGNSLWGKSGGGGNYDYSRSISTDASGNVYTIGYFSSTTFDLNGDTLLVNPSGTYMYSTYIAKYSNSGIFEWARLVGAPSTIGTSIAAGSGVDVYFTGRFTGTAPFGTTDLISGGSYDVFVADIFEFQSGISSTVDASCFGLSDGAAYSYAAAGHLPYAYLWNTTPAQTAPDATDLAAGNYQVEITDAFGCSQVTSFSIGETSADSALICLVTVDDLSQHNIIAWDKSSFTDVDSFIIYREITTSNYQPIAVIPYDSLSQFVDTVSTLYFPNTGNPNVGTYRYKIQAKSSCGSNGPMSPYHNTLFITNTGGTFTWPQLYVIEGGTNPVISYVLMRDDYSDGNWNAVGSVAGTQSFIVDPDYNTYESTASWRVETVWSISCTPTKSYSTSYSNTYSNQPLNVIYEAAQSGNFAVYPNPFSGATSISYSLPEQTHVKLVVLNELGQVIETLTCADQEAGTYQFVFDAQRINCTNGIYFIQISLNDALLTKKIALIK